jgi:hypothetical protein
MKKIISAILGLLLLIAPATVQALPPPLSGGGFDYIINAVDTNTITVTNYIGGGTIVAIPSAINSLTVTVVGNGTNAVFSSSVLSVTIPNSVTSIEDDAFFECSGLTNVTIPDSVTGFGASVFFECSDLTNVTLPNSITSIGYEAFYDCYDLTNINIPDSVTSIGESAFEDCYDLSNVVIGNNVTYIGYDAFDDCGMTTLTIGNNVKIANGGCTIEYDAFYDCYQLKNLTIGVNVASIGYDAFSDCNELTNATIGSGAIAYEAFYDLSDLTNVTLGNGVTSIDYEAFYDCGHLQTVTIGSGVTSIGYEAFEDCSQLKTLTIIGNASTSIGYEAFEDCSELTSATIENGVIGYESFEYCYALANLTLGNGVTSIGYEAFYDCYEALTSLTIPDSVTSIGYEAFEECEVLTHLTIGNGVPSIPYYAFEDCYALTTVTFGASVGDIGYEAFDDCTNLVGLYFRGNAPTVDMTAFYSDTNVNLTAYYYAGATGWGSTLDGYIPTMELEPNSLQVTLGPTAAIEAGAQWQLDGGGLNNGGLTTLDDITLGSHTVSFTSIAGWVAPPNQTFTISNGGTASVVGLYTPTTTPANGLILLVNGNGTIHHSAWPSVLTIGKTYTVMAKPQSENNFTFWAGGASQPYAVLSTSASYTFIMEPNLELVANFIANPFSPVAAIYNGLFSTPTGVTEETAGMLKGLTVHQNGTYSGTLLINGGSHGISGSFNSASMAATNHILRPASQGGPLLVEMTLDFNDSPSQVTGLVSGTTASGSNAGPWTASLTAYLATTNSLFPAEYTVLIPPDTNNAPPANSPGGDGYALITNNFAGTAKITGALADGTALSQTAPISQGSSYVPIYANLYHGKGLLLGWLNLDVASLNPNTGLTWIHPATTKGSYQTGFTNVLLGDQILLSPWTNPPAGLALLTSLVTLGAIGDTNGVTNTVMTSAAGDISGTGVSGTINPKTGLFKVTLGSGADKTNGYGAILLNATNGGGYYLNGTNAQAIELEP